MAVIHQQLSVIPMLTISENLHLGRELRNRAGLIDRQRQNQACKAAYARLGLDVQPGKRVATLSPGKQQLVEIVRALSQDSRLLILDEPTSALGSKERAALLEMVSAIAAQGAAVVYVTHLLDEVFQVGDRVTVLRDGRVALSSHVGATSVREVVRAMTGHEASAPLANPARTPTSTAVRKPVLELTQFAAGAAPPLDLTAWAGEIVGLFGLLGSGRTGLLESVFGVRPSLGGSVSVAGKKVAIHSPRDAIRSGLALVPSDRAGAGIFPSMTSGDNVTLPHIRSLGHALLRSRQKETAEFAAAVRKLDIQPPRQRALAANLSGGNAQKLVVGRWLVPAAKTVCMLLDEPTQGVDVRAREQIYEQLREFVHNETNACLLSSSDPEEIAAVCNRAFVIAEGRIIAESTAPMDASELLEIAHAARSNE